MNTDVRCKKNLNDDKSFIRSKDVQKLEFYSLNLEQTFVPRHNIDQK